MIGVVIATHATLASGLLGAVELIAGKQENVEVLGLFHEDGVEEFRSKVEVALAKVDQGDGVIGFVDFLGGTPSNVMLECMRSKRFPCIAGANMPMVLTALTSRDGGSVEAIVEDCLEVGKDGMIELGCLMDASETEEELDDF